MNKNNLLKVALLPLVLAAAAGCDGNGGQPTFDFDKETDVYGVLPTTVTDANVSIDFLVYIEGQNGTIEDIGNYSPILDEDGDPYDPIQGKKRLYGPEDIEFIEAAKYFAAASEFKRYCPDVKINLIYCSIGDYNKTIQAYREQYKHLPHLMWATDHVVEMMEVGMAVDVSQYDDAAYYDSYNDYMMSRFRFGNFQAGFPIAAEPWGVFVNTDDLVEYNVLNKVYEDGVCTDEYKEWVDNFTWEAFMEAVKATSTDNHAGLDKVVEYLVSYSLDTVNAKFLSEGQVDLTGPEVDAVMSRLLGYENELAMGNGYTAYIHDASRPQQGTADKTKFPNLADWAGTKNFVEDQYFTFTASAPWSLTTYSQYIEEHNLQDEITIDFLPYPKVDEDAFAYSGIAVEGLTVGQQCIIGSDENGERCENGQAELEQEVAAYFAMFFGCDPRAIESRKNVKYVFNGTPYEGSLSLPIIKRGFQFDWQDDPELSKDDPSLDYDDNWQYQLALWLEVYNAYVTDDQPADVEDFTNVSYGLTKMLDTIYGDEVSTLNFWNEPVNVYENNEPRDIFDNWQQRYAKFVNTDSNSGYLGSPDYVSEVMARLAEVEEDINANAEKAWLDLNDKVYIYYGTDEDGEPLYTIDRTGRNDYEGSIFN